MKLENWGQKKIKESKPILRVCEIHGNLIFENQVYMTKTGHKVYYHCKACRTISKNAKNNYIDHLGTIE
jgi:hypothetical protein